MVGRARMKWFPSVLLYCLVGILTITSTLAWPFSASVDDVLPHLHKPSEEDVGHKCIHDQLAQEMQAQQPAAVRQQYGAPGPTLSVLHTAENSEDAERLHILQTSNWGPLRIKVVSRLDEDKDAEGRNSTCFSVGEVIRVGNPSGNTLCSATVSRNCLNTCTEDQVLTSAKKAYIQDRVVPDAIKKLGEVLKVRQVNGVMSLSGSQCGISSITPVTVASSEVHHTGADFIIFLTARPTFGATIAYALSCDSDNLGRPISGQFNWGPNQVDVLAYPKQLGVALHELTHALGFSSSWYSRYIDGDTLQPRSAVLGSTRDAKTGGSLGVTQVITPNVVSKIKSHFGCNSATGGLLEDQGGGGTGGSHWEKRLYLNEYMTGSASSNPVFSEITLALFKDMGYYDPDYTQADPFPFGKNKGCSFLGACWGRDPDHYCSDSSVEACTLDRRAKGFCGIVQYSTSLPTLYAPFPSTPTLGGLDTLADYCPYIVGYSNGLCTDTNNQKDADPLGQVYGARSRCMMSTLTDKQYSNDEQRRMACYPVACVQTSVGVRIKIQVGKFWLDCPGSSGGRIVAPGFDGDVICPDVASMCTTEKVEQNWPVLNITAPVLPNRGRESGGTRITISGENFDQERTYKVLIGDRRCRAVRYKTAQTLQCVTSRKKLGILESEVSFDVLVSDDTDRSVIAVGGFTYTSGASRSMQSLLTWGVILAAVIFTLV